MVGAASRRGLLLLLALLAPDLSVLLPHRVGAHPAAPRLRRWFTRRLQAQVEPQEGELGGRRESAHLKLQTIGAKPDQKEGEKDEAEDEGGWALLEHIARDGRVFACAGSPPDATEFTLWLRSLDLGFESDDDPISITRQRLGDTEEDMGRLRLLWKTRRLLVQDRDLLNQITIRGSQFRDHLFAYAKRMRTQLAHEPSFNVSTLTLSLNASVSDLDEFRPKPDDPEETRARLGRLLQLFRERLPYYYDRCLSCGNDKDNIFLGVVAAEPDEAVAKAGRVEVHACSACGSATRFPRTNDVTEILKARRGRCGEYSVAMHQVLAFLGYDVRWIVDWADHVWVEVHLDSGSEKDWVHCDPCEASLGEPLLYESWGKNQTYILAFAPTYVQDVTSRYTSNMTAAVARRELSAREFDSLLNNATSYLRGERETIFED